MAKTKRMLSLFLVALMTVFTVLSYVPAKAATTPKVAFVTKTVATYTQDQTISFSVKAANYTGKVMYRVMLSSGKNYINIWNTPKTGYYYTKWTPTGTTTFPIHWAASQLKPGFYSMTVLVKRVGSKAPYDTYVNTASFEVKSSEATISSIDDVKATAEQGATYTLPATVTAKMSDGTTKDVAVVWTPATVDTTKAGDQKFVGKVENYDKDVNLTLTVNELQVKSVSVIGASKLKVVMSAPVDTTKATFEVKNGSFLVPATVAWNDTKTEATLTKTYGKYMSGDYTVTVKGLSITAGKDAGKVTVADEAIDTIKFASTSLVKAATGNTATIGYTVLNQYGEDITKTATILGVSSYGTVGAAAGVATVDKGSAWSSTDPTTGSVTLYNGTKAVTATVTLVAACSVDTVTLGDMVLPKDTVRLSGDVVGVKVNYNAVDQYGNAVTLTDLTGITVVCGTGVSNPRIGTDPFDATKKALLVDVSTVPAETTATLTAIVNKTGKVSTTSFKLYPVSDIKDFTLTPDTSVIKAGTGYKVWIDAVDTYGDAIKAADLAVADAKFQVTSLNNDVFTVAADPIKLDATTKKAYIDLSPVTAGKTANLIVTLKANGKNATLPISVNAASEIVGMTLSTNVLNFASNGSATLKATFIDQYNEAVKADANYTIVFATSDTAVIGKPVDSTVAGMVAGVKIAPVADVVNKAATLTVTLMKGATTIDSQDVAIKVIDSSKTTLTYTIADIAKLNGLAAFDQSSDYAAKLTLTAKDSTGNTIYVPNSVIKSVTSTNNALVAIQQDATTKAYYICGLAAGIPAGSTETSATITVIVENYDGTISIATKTVTVSKAALVPASLEAYLADGETEVAGDIEGLATGAHIDAANVPDAAFQFAAVDQYGVAMEVGTYVITNNTTGATVSVDAHGVVTITGTPATGTSFNITAITTNGLYKTVKVVY